MSGGARLATATRKGLVRARRLLKQIAGRRDIVLFAAPAPGVVEHAARRARMPWVAGRWIGGTLTNFRTTRACVARLAELESWERDGTIARYSKRERARLVREKRRLLEHVGGLRAMDRLPRALVLVDATRQPLAVAEARKVRAATVGLGETREAIDVVVPGATADVARMVVESLADAVVRGTPRPEDPPAPEPRRRRRPRPPPDDDPGTAPVPARLRPGPTPGQARARRGD